MLQGYESAVLNNRGVRSVTVFCESEVGRCLGVVIRSPTVQSWQYPGWWTHVLPRQGVYDQQSIGEERVWVAVRHRIEYLVESSGTRLRLGGLNGLKLSQARI
jgi:hypothetical protein